MEYIKLGDMVNIKTGKLNANEGVEGGKYPFFTCSSKTLEIDKYSYDCECVLVAGNGDLNVKYYNGKFDAYQRTYIIESKYKLKLNNQYMYYFLSKYIEKLRNNAIGGVIKYIKLNNLTDIIFPLPRLENQKKIVEVLDKAQSLIDKKREQIELLDELVKSRFIEIFGDIRINEKGWEEKEISNLLISIDSGKSFVCEGYERKGEYPAILKLSAVTYGVYNPLENKALIDANEFIDNMEVKEGDLLFTRKNTPELVGMCAYVYKTTPNLMMPDLIFRLNTNENCNKIYLWKLINNEMFREKIKMISNGSAKSMSNISKQNLMKLKVPVPPIELQNEFAEFVTKTDSIRSKMEESLSELEDNFNSLMQRSFKGELF